MLELIRKHLTYANVAATLAVVLAITGSAVAATDGIGHDDEDPGGKHNGPGGKGGGKGNSDGSAYVVSAHAAKGKGGKGSRGPRGARGPAGSTGKEGKEGKAGATGPAGKEGAPGKEGAAGPAGAASTVQGPKGEKGELGASGVSVTSRTITPYQGNPECKAGGTEFTSAEGHKTFACNGEGGGGGEPGFPETLPMGKSETGTWFLHDKVPAEAGGSVLGSVAIAISFPVPLAAPITTGEDLHYVTTAEQGGARFPAGCEAEVNGVMTKGSVEHPLAKAGNFCIYQGTIEEEPAEVESLIIATTGILLPGRKLHEAGAIGTGTSGAVAHVYYEGPNEGPIAMQGSWAVAAAE